MSGGSASSYIRAAASLPPSTPGEDRDTGLWGEFRSAPLHDVVLQYTGAFAFDQRTALQRNAAIVGAPMLVKGSQLLGTLVDVRSAGGLPCVPVGFEGVDDRIHIAGRERTEVAGHVVGRTQRGVGLQQRRAVDVAPGQLPAAVVDPQLLDPPSPAAIGDNRDGKIDRAALAVEVQDHLLEAAGREDDVLDVLDRDVVLREPALHLGDEGLELRDTPDPSPDRVVHDRLIRERVDQGVELAGRQPVEERHSQQLGPPPLLQQALQGRRTEQLRHPRHAASLIPVAGLSARSQGLTD